METVYDNSGKERTSLRIKKLPDMPLLFAYMPREGLVRINKDTGAVESKDLLGELLGIREGDKKGIMKFFSENGFLFPITAEGLETFSFDDIFLIVRRVRETLNVISLLYENRLQYKKITSAICWLTLSRGVTIRSIDKDLEEFKTCHHCYMKYLDKLREGAYGFSDSELYEQNEIHVPDTVYPPETAVSISSLMSTATVGAGEEGGPVLSRYHAAILFLHERGESPSDKKVIDYFYHLTSEVGGIVSVADEKAEVEFECGDADSSKRLSTHLREASIDVAKMIIKEELDYAINSIFPSYDADTMTGSWVIPDFYAALFFSIFYMKPGIQLYRECENPSCGSFFLVSTTNHRRKYCSDECSNAMQQRKHRLRKKKKASTGVDAID